ncbi:MAG TPA: hypothetical protein VHK91_13710 [Flavisolibacter sp.]|jgi:hypothetical protein|nr:hypothetical protein [Flavisolibacter sp.]
MQFLSLAPFIPSGPDLVLAKRFFQDLGFTLTWDAGDYAGFEKDGCPFILQNYNDKHFAENLMINVRVTDADAFYAGLKDKKLEETYGIRIMAPTNMPYGREVNVIDPAGVCWHFVS